MYRESDSEGGSFRIVKIGSERFESDGTENPAPSHLLSLDSYRIGQPRSSMRMHEASVEAANSEAFIPRSSQSPELEIIPSHEFLAELAEQERINQQSTTTQSAKVVVPDKTQRTRAVEADGTRWRPIVSIKQLFRKGDTPSGDTPGISPVEETWPVWCPVHSLGEVDKMGRVMHMTFFSTYTDATWKDPSRLGPLVE